MANHSECLLSVWHVDRPKKRRGEESEWYREMAAIAKNYAFTDWTLTVAMAKVNSAALRIELVNTDLLVAVLTYSATFAAIGFLVGRMVT